MMAEFVLACPVCRSVIQVEGESGICERNGHPFSRREGIWRFLPEEREREFQDFARDYRLVRAAEGWGAASAAYYRGLPEVARDDPQRAIWRLRARSYTRLLTLLGSAERLTVLDAGAGNAWLSNRLAARGHHVAALDLSDDARDGLGARVNYETRFECYQAEFDRLPFAAEQFDRVIFSAALHYSTSLPATLCEARRVLRRDGQIVVLDSPCYARAAGGAAMIAARERGFAGKFGFKRSVRQIGFLTREQLQRAAVDAGLALRARYGDDSPARKIRRAWAGLRAGREAARFPLLVLEAP